MTGTPQPSPKRRLKVEPEPEGVLEQLLITNKSAHDAKEKADEAESDAKGEIKSWLLSLFPDPRQLPDAFDIAADPHGRYPAYTMTLKTGVRIDSKRLQQEAEDVYNAYIKPVRPSWELRENTHGRR